MLMMMVMLLLLLLLLPATAYSDDANLIERRMMLPGEAATSGPLRQILKTIECNQISWPAGSSIQTAKAGPRSDGNIVQHCLIVLRV
uniref:Putative secreted protein n=1 Tax=Anopheles marajoara TaxID=58244 RepID=A0A2M4CAH2_9DIPT